MRKTMAVLVAAGFVSVGGAAAGPVLAATSGTFTATGSMNSPQPGRPWGDSWRNAGVGEPVSRA